MIRLGFGFLSIASGLRLRHYGVLQKPEVRLTCPRGPQGKDGVYGEVCVSGVCINKEKSKGTGLLKGTMNSLFLKGLAAKTHRGLRGSIEAGRSACSISFGYRVRYEFDAIGDPVRGGREIEIFEATSTG